MVSCKVLLVLLVAVVVAAMATGEELKREKKQILAYSAAYPYSGAYPYAGYPYAGYPYAGYPYTAAYPYGRYY